MTTATLLGSIREHLDTFDLPEPWGVRVNAGQIYRHAQVTVQLTGEALPTVASQLLAWADTLTDISAEACRIHGSDSVHLTVQGRLTDGTTVRVFNGVDHGPRFSLESDEQRMVSLACLREWASLNEGAAA